MRAIGQPSPTRPQIYISTARAHLRVKLINEEAKEFEDAILGGGVRNASDTTTVTAEQVDALCDLLYVTYGAAVEMGIDLESCFELVHEANLRKVPGPVREDGKKLKPEGWMPPDIEGELARIYRSGR